MRIGSKEHKELADKLSYRLVKDQYGDMFGVVQRHMDNTRHLNEAIEIVRQLKDETHPSTQSGAYDNLHRALMSIKL